MSTAAAGPVDINRIAAAVAREITSRGCSTPPQIQVGDVDALAIGGSVDIVIKVGTTTYTLTVAAPTLEKNEWVFQLDMQREGQEKTPIAGFTINPETKAWSVNVGLPKIEISPTFIIEKVQVKLMST